VNRKTDGQLKQLQKDIAGLKTFTGYSTGKPASRNRIVPALVISAIAARLLFEAVLRHRRDPYPKGSPQARFWKLFLYALLSKRRQ
jgi:hypothetical protein